MSDEDKTNKTEQAAGREASELHDLLACDAKHELVCKHCVGTRCKTYTMKCTLIKIMKGRRVKIVVFGNRYWRDNEHIKRIRYVSMDSVRLAS